MVVAGDRVGLGGDKELASGPVLGMDLAPDQPAARAQLVFALNKMDHRWAARCQPGRAFSRGKLRALGTP